MQVGLLEEGKVLIQHRGLAPAERTQLEAAAGDDVVVAPAPSLPAAIVATAWLTKRSCTSVDVDALAGFATRYRDRGPDGHG